MLHTRNVAKAQNYRVRFFSTKQLHLRILCTFSRFSESGLNRSDWLPNQRMLLYKNIFCLRLNLKLWRRRLYDADGTMGQSP